MTTPIPWPTGLDPEVFLTAANDPAAVAGIVAWALAENLTYFDPDGDDPDDAPTPDDPREVAQNLRRIAFNREHVLRPFVRALGAAKVELSTDPVEARDEWVAKFNCPGCRKPMVWEDRPELTEDGDDTVAWMRVYHLGRGECGYDILAAMADKGWRFPRFGGDVVDWSMVALMARPAGPDWLIPGVMERGELAALFGPPKAGKSLRAQEWAHDLAGAGTTVLYLDKENRLAEFWSRARAMGAAGASLANLKYVSLPDLWIDTDDGAARVHELAERFGAELVVFDSWARFFAGGSQNDDTTANRVYGSVLLPLRKRGVGVLRLDHTGHEGKRPSGTIVKLADIDHGWRLNTDGDQVTLTHTENRTGRGADIIRERRLTSPVLRHVPAGQATPPDVPTVTNVERLVDALDRLSVPLDWGRGRVKGALVEAGIGAKTDDLDQAILHRRQPV